MSGPTILICDDEMLIRVWLEEHLREEGYDAESVGEGEALLARLSEGGVDLVLLDLRLPDRSGLELLPGIQEQAPGVPVIMITAYGDVETAVQAVRAGAHYFLEKPVDLAELLVLIEQALETSTLRRQLEQYREGHRWQFSDVTLVGRSTAIRKVAELITRIASQGNPATVLIRGESGTGKDVVARAVHARGPRARAPFVRVNCTALPENLVESELFGHEGGAFTDAKETKKGLFEIAHGGTILLDEVGDMPLGAQTKLLGVLESHAFRRVGGTRDLTVDVQVLAATNRDLESAVAEGQFREDLYYRLNVIPIELPPLRDRPEDIAPLALHFVEVLAEELRQPRRELTEEAIRLLEWYEWPGNARELRNVLERVVLLHDQERITAAMLPPMVKGEEGAERSERLMVLPASGLSLDELEQELICQALERTDGNKTGAARLLGISRDTLRYRLQKFEIT